MEDKQINRCDQCGVQVYKVTVCAYCVGRKGQTDTIQSQSPHNSHFGWTLRTSHSQRRPSAIDDGANAPEDNDAQADRL